jgi:hypothetical protein
MNRSGNAISYFFYPDEGSLKPVTIVPKQKRVGEAELVKEAGGVYPGVLYLECKNLHNLPKQSKGVVIAYKEKPDVKKAERDYGEQEPWRLGYIWKVDKTSLICNLLEWNGLGESIYFDDEAALKHAAKDEMSGTILKRKRSRSRSESRSPSPIRPGSKRRVPLFHNLNPADFNRDAVPKHFTPKTINLLCHPELRYLNQVMGPRPLCMRKEIGDDRFFKRVSEEDHCFVQSNDGPDIITLPQMKEWNFPMCSEVSSSTVAAPVLGPLPENVQDVTGQMPKYKRQRNRMFRLPPYLKEANQVSQRLFDSHPFRTYYVPNLEGRTQLTTKPAFLWPLGGFDNTEEHHEVTFALLQKQHLLYLSSYSGRLSPTEMDAKVRGVCDGTIRLRDLGNVSTGVRIRVVDDAEMQEISSDSEAKAILLSSDFGSKPVHYRTRSGAPHTDPGVMLSFWLEDKELHKAGSITMDLVSQIFGIVRDGYGTRGAVGSIGINWYLGQVTSSQANSSTLIAREDVGKQQYYRQEFKDSLRPQIEKMVHPLSLDASIFARRGDALVHGFLSGKSNANQDNISPTPCAISLVTTGRPGGAIKSRYLAFASAPHLDPSDLYPGSKVKELEDKISKHEHELVSSLANMPTEQKRLVQRRLDYLTRFKLRVGLGTPTTCAYQFVAAANIDVLQYFILEGLGLCVRLTSFLGHSFYAYTFVHCTSICLMRKEGKVHFVMDDALKACVFAWGECKNRESDGGASGGGGGASGAAAGGGHGTAAGGGGGHAAAGGGRGGGGASGAAAGGGGVNGGNVWVNTHALLSKGIGRAFGAGIPVLPDYLSCLLGDIFPHRIFCVYENVKIYDFLALLVTHSTSTTYCTARDIHAALEELARDQSDLGGRQYIRNIVREILLGEESHHVSCREQEDDKIFTPKQVVNDFWKTLCQHLPLPSQQRVTWDELVLVLTLFGELFQKTVPVQLFVLHQGYLKDHNPRRKADLMRVNKHAVVRGKGPRSGLDGKSWNDQAELLRFFLGGTPQARAKPECVQAMAEWAQFHGPWQTQHPHTPDFYNVSSTPVQVTCPSTVTMHPKFKFLVLVHNTKGDLQLLLGGWHQGQNGLYPFQHTSAKVFNF